MRTYNFRNQQGQIKPLNKLYIGTSLEKSYNLEHVFSYSIQAYRMDQLGCLAECIHSLLFKDTRFNRSRIVELISFGKWLCEDVNESNFNIIAILSLNKIITTGYDKQHDISLEKFLSDQQELQIDCIEAMRKLDSDELASRLSKLSYLNKYDVENILEFVSLTQNINSITQNLSSYRNFINLYKRSYTKSATAIYKAQTESLCENIEYVDSCLKILDSFRNGTDIKEISKDMKLPLSTITTMLKTAKGLELGGSRNMDILLGRRTAALFRSQLEIFSISDYKTLLKTKYVELSGIAPNNKAIIVSGIHKMVDFLVNFNGNDDIRDVIMYIKKRSS